MKPTQYRERPRTGDLFLNNPANGELQRAAAKLTGVGLQPKVRSGALGTLAVIYLFAIVQAMAHANVTNSAAVLVLAAIVTSIALPAALHGAIAGEKERRTWEVLMVAPVSPAQIVMAKFMGGAIINLAVCALTLPFLLISQLGGDNRTSVESLPWVAVSLLALVLYGMAVSALCIYISSRCKRVFAAQGGAFGSMAAFLVGWPIITAILTRTDEVSLKWLNFLNPFFWLSEVWGGTQSKPLLGVGPVVCVVYFVATIFYLRAATKRVAKDRGESI